MMTPPGDAEWDAWTPQELARRLAGVAAHWYVVGGWALDLWHGAPRRAHDDLEFATSPKNAPVFAAALPELEFFQAQRGRMRHWDATRPITPDVWQFWGADRQAKCWRVDMMMERGGRTQWHYKRAPSVRQARNAAIRVSPAGIRYLAPANVLLFKAKHCREKDNADFEAALPGLSGQDRDDLRGWLAECHPDHHWLARLSGGA